jgi:hypothetical protein
MNPNIVMARCFVLGFASSPQPTFATLATFPEQVIENEYTFSASGKHYLLPVEQGAR